MCKTLFLLSSLLLLFGQTWAQDQLTPLEETLGDLDQDGVNERVVVYNTDRDTTLGKVREVHIFKKEGDKKKNLPSKKTKKKKKYETRKEKNKRKVKIKLFMMIRFILKDSKASVNLFNDK